MIKAGLVFSTGLMLLLVGCSGQKPATTEVSTVDYLAEQFADGVLARSSEAQLFEGEALYEHIDGGAEVYHLYQFVEVATAYYQSGETELLVDLYRFADADNAYGLYSNLRPEEPQIARIGIEGSLSDGRLDCVKGAYVVSITAYDIDGQSTPLMLSLARAITTDLSGSCNLPSRFADFPADGAIAHTETMVAEAYLGQSFLDHVYTRNYLVGDDTLTLFLTPDADRQKLAKWLEVHPGSGDNPGFDDDAFVEWDNSYYGRIVAGRKGRQLVGAVGLTEATSGLLGNWLRAAP
ncbi:MAG: DUF6599 family protein [bacterium]